MGNINTDWLAKLASAHAPAPIGWWPPAPGWWALAILLLAAIALVFYYLRHPNIQLRRAALRKLKELEVMDAEDMVLASSLEHLLRRYAVARFGRELVASLSGEAWIAFVAAHGGTELAGESGVSLLRMAYGGHATPNRALWFSGARKFIKDRS